MEAFHSQLYGTLPGGTPVRQFMLTNNNGMQMNVIEYGGIITHLTAADRDGNFEDVVLGHDSLEDYLNSEYYLGALIGRYGNRIANGCFMLNGTEYQLARNNGINSLHGGPGGFHTKHWKGEQVEQDGGVALKLSCTSPDGEEGFPGTLTVEVTYTLTHQNALHIEYKARTDTPTVVNLTQHSYFNLSGMKDDISGHELMIHADTFLPVDENILPTGEFAPVNGTPFDFSTAKSIGLDIEADHPQLKPGNGFDHNWVLNESGKNEPELAARVAHPPSGRVMEVYTTEPGMQFYSGNALKNDPPGKRGTSHHPRTGFCLETQHFPNSPNMPEFPSTVLNANEEYQTKTVYRFLVNK